MLTGSSKAFAAGADIKEMKSRNYVDSYLSNQFKVYSYVVYYASFHVVYVH